MRKLVRSTRARRAGSKSAERRQRAVTPAVSSIRLSTPKPSSATPPAARPAASATMASRLLRARVAYVRPWPRWTSSVRARVTGAKSSRCRRVAAAPPARAAGASSMPAYRAPVCSSDLARRLAALATATPCSALGRPGAAAEEWQRQDLAEPQPSFITPIPQSEGRRQGGVRAERGEEAIPSDQERPEVGVRLLRLGTVMDAMHGRRHERPPQHRLEPGMDADVRVLELSRQQQHDLEGDEALVRDPEQGHERQLGEARCQDFAEMEAGRGADVEVQV